MACEVPYSAHWVAPAPAFLAVLLNLLQEPKQSTTLRQHQSYQQLADSR